MRRRIGGDLDVGSVFGPELINARRMKLVSVLKKVGEVSAFPIRSKFNMGNFERLRMVSSWKRPKQLESIHVQVA